MFAYCRNNPVCHVDNQGFADQTAVGNDDGLILSSDDFEDRKGSGGSTNSGSGNSSGCSGTRDSGRKTETHHIVEQCQERKSGFHKNQIQDENNKVQMSYEDHRRISGYYSSIQPYSNEMRVRNWLVGLSFEQQLAFGWRIIQELFGGKYGEEMDLS